MAHGCPMLALDVLSGLPKHLSMVTDISEAIKSAENKAWIKLFQKKNLFMK